jgi:hypothetical protein
VQSTDIPRVAILNGGLVFHKLTEAEMYLRRFYFSQSGIYAPGIITGSKKPDLIQVCPETCDIIVCRDNLYYIHVQDPDSFAEAMNEIMGDIFREIEE